MSEEVLDPNKHDRRPWGSYTVVDEGSDYKVKRIEVLGQKRLSYQRHKFRGEHWYVVAGTGTVTLDGQDYEVKVGEAIDIPLGAAHRMANLGDELLVFIEVQRGSYLGEDDIERLQDDFGRSS
ncbi:MAG: phosphomannose isomerase type II C-terminal cupin domain [Deltaproteobacteria bacterium]|jgi:mannose-6-phosphate isomerase|nr:phosphomannose isomerase type II C-terminal cupin domain [Deltaproteobacteria bacterium]